MMLPTIEIFASVDCPYAYLATYRLRRVWPEFEGRVNLLWRALSLEYVNERPAIKPLLEAERPLFARIEPNLPWQRWQTDAWRWPTTMWPAFEALACAQAQSVERALALSWGLRHAFYAESRNIALRHEILRIASDAGLDMATFEADWDCGKFKQLVIDSSRRGWHELKLDGSVSFLLPDGQTITNPAIGEVDFDEETYQLNGYEPFDGDPLAVYREMLQRVVDSAATRS